MRSAVSSSDDGYSTGTAFLTDFFFEADIRSRHSCTTFLAGFFSWKTFLKRTDLTPHFVLFLSCIVAPSCHRGSTGALPGRHRHTTVAQPAATGVSPWTTWVVPGHTGMNRGYTVLHRNYSVVNRGSTGASFLLNRGNTGVTSGL